MEPYPFDSLSELWFLSTVDFLEEVRRKMLDWFRSFSYGGYKTNPSAG
jgi:hypothetical protein